MIFFPRSIWIYTTVVIMGIFTAFSFSEMYLPPKMLSPDLMNLYHHTLNTSFDDEFDEILVIGDVHGCYDELQQLLQISNSTGNNSLKILAGDFLTRGPKSIEVLNYLKSTPSVLAIRGNHDDFVLEKYYETNFTDFFGPHDHFIRDLLIDHIRFLYDLPYTITIPSQNAIVVHAGLLPGTPLEHNTPNVMVHMRNIKVDNVTGEMCPLRIHTEGTPWATLWDGPTHVFFGHDHPLGLQKFSSATGIDTSCVYGGNLTATFIKGPRKGTMTQLKCPEAYYTRPKYVAPDGLDHSCLQ